MQVQVPESENLRGQLLLQGPLTVGMMTGIYLGSLYAPSTLFAAVTAGVGTLVGFGVGLVLVNWRAKMSATEYRPIFE